MKKLVILFSLQVLYMIALPTMAQGRTLVNRDFDLSTLYGLTLRSTEFYDDSIVPSSNYRIGLIIDNAFLVGLDSGFIYNSISGPEPYNSSNLNLRYYGLAAGYIKPFHERTQLSANILIGYGLARYTFYPQDHYVHYITHYNVVVVKPSVELMLGVTERFWIGLGGSYRYVRDIDQGKLPYADMSGLSAGLTLYWRTRRK